MCVTLPMYWRVNYIGLSNLTGCWLQKQDPTIQMVWFFCWLMWDSILIAADFLYLPHLFSQLFFAGQGRQCSYLHPQAGSGNWCLEVLHSWARLSTIDAQEQILSYRGSPMDGWEIQRLHLKGKTLSHLLRCPSCELLVVLVFSVLHWVGA